MVQYIDKDGWRTQDYTMDASDVARMAAGTDISGQAKDPTLYPLDHYVGNPAAPTAFNRTRSMVPPVVTSQSGGIPGLPFQMPLSTTLPPGVTSTSQLSEGQARAMDPEALRQMMQREQSAVTIAQTPLDYSNSTNLYTSQRKRAAAIGMSALFDQLSGGQGSSNSDLKPVIGADGVERYTSNFTGHALMTSQPGANGIGPDLPGSKKSGPGIDGKMASDPRFRTLMALNPDNAKRFYSLMNGTDYDTDLKTSQALLDTQNTNQLAVGKDVASKAIAATKDQPELGIKKGDIVKQVIQPGLLPGTVAVGEAPLTDLESKAYGIVKGPNGSTSYVPGSWAHKAFGASTISDDRAQSAADLARQAELHAKSRVGSVGDPLAGTSKDARVRMTTSGVVQRTADEQSAVDTDAGMAGAVGNFGDATVSTLRGIQNFGNGLQNIGNKVVNYFGGPKNALGTPTFTKNNDEYLDQGGPSPEEKAAAARMDALRAAGIRF